jgi:hypothetical protein
MEKMIKIAIFEEIGSSTPLYEENSTMLESNTIMLMKTKMNRSGLFTQGQGGITNYYFFLHGTKKYKVCTKRMDIRIIYTLLLLGYRKK